MGKVSILVVLVVIAAVGSCNGKVVKTRPRFSSRIVGGRNATHGEFPFIVSLHWEDFGHFCGGSILAPNAILTAAHCMYGYEEDHYEVVAGDWHQSNDDGTEQRRVVSRMALHEGYDDWTFENDIAILFVDPPFQFNDYVKAIPVPPLNHTASGDAPVAGWGTTTEDGELSDILQVVTLQIISDEQCRREIPGDPSYIADHMICAYYLPGGRDSCQGDSGGPLMASEIGTTYIAGIVSWGWGCAQPGVPGMYTEVSHFTQWIIDHIRA